MTKQSKLEETIHEITKGNPYLAICALEYTAQKLIKLGGKKICQKELNLWRKSFARTAKKFDNKTETVKHVFE